MCSIVSWAFAVYLCICCYYYTSVFLNVWALFLRSIRVSMSVSSLLFPCKWMCQINSYFINFRKIFGFLIFAPIPWYMFCLIYTSMFSFSLEWLVNNIMCLIFVSTYFLVSIYKCDWFFKLNFSLWYNCTILQPGNWHCCNPSTLFRLQLYTCSSVCVCVCIDGFITHGNYCDGHRGEGMEEFHQRSPSCCPLVPPCHSWVHNS